MSVKFFSAALLSVAAASTLVLSGCMESSEAPSTEPAAVVEEMPMEEGAAAAEATPAEGAAEMGHEGEAAHAEGAAEMGHEGEAAHAEGAAEHHG